MRMLADEAGDYALHRKLVSIGVAQAILPASGFT
jgi:hypothetical protein